MANLITCDGGCGALSPNPKTRLHDANHWLRVRAHQNTRFDAADEDDDLLFCKVCAPRVAAALQPSGGEG